MHSVKKRRLAGAVVAFDSSDRRSNVNTLFSQRPESLYPKRFQIHCPPRGRLLHLLVWHDKVQEIFLPLVLNNHRMNSSVHMQFRILGTDGRNTVQEFCPEERNRKTPGLSLIAQLVTGIALILGRALNSQPPFLE